MEYRGKRVMQVNYASYLERAPPLHENKNSARQNRGRATPCSWDSLPGEIPQLSFGKRPSATGLSRLKEKNEFDMQLASARRKHAVQQRLQSVAKMRHHLVWVDRAHGQGELSPLEAKDIAESLVESSCGSVAFVVLPQAVCGGHRCAGEARSTPRCVKPCGATCSITELCNDSLNDTQRREKRRKRRDYWHHDSSGSAESTKTVGFDVRHECLIATDTAGEPQGTVFHDKKPSCAVPHIRNFRYSSLSEDLPAARLSRSRYYDDRILMLLRRTAVSR
ncbi:hypothetical protein ERJ75_001519900 [Trypanosoma vivax]|nr:hypothetical protein ERJ75_001521300 [Trypanosoma vivax]KAH8606460.1 hypothetical protein ERJ75_001519900 [Trypanosoma vivax]